MENQTQLPFLTQKDGGGWSSFESFASHLVKVLMMLKNKAFTFVQKRDLLEMIVRNLGFRV